MFMKFTWDHEKNKINQKKHKISFEEAILVFRKAIFIYDKEHSTYSEDRFLAFGTVKVHGFITVVFIEVVDDEYRIISARKATQIEVKKYV
jgi:uncharacterized protein